MTPLSLHLQASQAQSAVQLLMSDGRLNETQIRTCFDHGAVWLEKTGKPRRVYRPDVTIQPAHRVHLYCNESTLAPCPYVPKLIRDFETFSLWYKPAGMFSQGSKWGDHWTLQRWVQQHHWPTRECLITHRLDRYTSGLMIIAHDAATNQALHRQFEQREIQKTYRAIVQGRLPVGESRTLDSTIDGKSAITRFRVLEQDPADDHSLLEIQPLTGRKHQIRIHLSQAGHPVQNDRQYGQPPHQGDLQLQACALTLRHPQSRLPVEVSVASEQLLQLTPRIHR